MKLSSKKNTCTALLVVICSPKIAPNILLPLNFFQYFILTFILFPTFTFIFFMVPIINSLFFSVLFLPR